MQSKRIFAHVAAAVAALLSAPAQACFFYPVPFSQHLSRAPAQTLAIRAEPIIEFSARTNEHWSGTISFQRIRCLRRPRGATCPAQFQVEFREDFDGASCPSVLYEDPRPGRASQLRYFMFLRDDAGHWRLTLASRRLDQ